MTIGAIALGADHAGFAIKESIRQYLEEREIPYHDFGCYSPQSCDYPDLAAQVAQGIQKGEFLQGILCCGSGVGIAIAANRFQGIRAVVCHDLYTAIMSRRHNNANVICFGGRIIAPDFAKELLDVFISTPFEAGRHTSRVQKIDSVVNSEHLPC